MSQIENDMAEVTAKIDPAPKSEDLALEKFNGLLSTVSNGTLDELRMMRDQIDDLMRAIQARDKALKEAFIEHVRYATNVLAAKAVISDHIKEITHQFKNGLPPMGETMTLASGK